MIDLGLHLCINDCLPYIGRLVSGPRCGMVRYWVVWMFLLAFVFYWYLIGQCNTLRKYHAYESTSQIKGRTFFYTHKVEFTQFSLSLYILKKTFIITVLWWQTTENLVCPPYLCLGVNLCPAVPAVHEQLAMRYYFSFGKTHWLYLECLFRVLLPDETFPVMHC